MTHDAIGGAIVLAPPILCLYCSPVLQQRSAGLTGLELLCNEHIVTDQPVIGRGSVHESTDQLLCTSVSQSVEVHASSTYDRLISNYMLIA